MRQAKLDSTNLRVLDELQADGRMSLAGLAPEVGPAISVLPGAGAAAGERVRLPPPGVRASKTLVATEEVKEAIAVPIGDRRR